MILVLERAERPLAGFERDLTRPVQRVNDVDFNSMSAVREVVADHRPDAVVMTGGLEDRNQCEEDPPRAFLQNGEWAIHLAAAAREFGAAPVYLSSAAVFGDGGGTYAEDHYPQGGSVYAQSKLRGERFLLRAAPQGIALRVGQCLEDGLAAERARFAAGPVGASRSELVNVVSAPGLGRALEAILEEGLSGFFHVGSAPVAESTVFLRLAEMLAGEVELSDRAGGAAMIPGRLPLTMPEWDEALREVRL